MAESARELGHEYIVLTDHSPSLTVANGLSAERLERELDEVATLNGELAPFRILTGIEVDILADGSLDQSPELLSRLDVVVGSVHSELRMAERQRAGGIDRRRARRWVVRPLRGGYWTKDAGPIRGRTGGPRRSGCCGWP